MATVTEPEEPPRTEPDEEEEGGGPVKTFLEHLEDLRWTLIKCVVAIAVSMVVCLVAGNKLIAVLTWPLEVASSLRQEKEPVVPVVVGTNIIGRIPLRDLGFGGQDTNRPSIVRIVPVKGETNYSLGLEFSTNNPAWKGSIVNLMTLGPIAPFMVALRVALYGGLALAAPFVFYFVGQFVLPALKVKEKKILFQAVGLGSVLFFAGVAFCYFVIMQVALLATVQFSQWMGFSAEQWRAEEYIGFVCKFMLGMGVSFELPVIILVLVKIGLLDYQKLTKFRAYFLIGILFLSAFITPSGDPVTMFLMAVPIYVLYEICVIIARVWERREREREGS